MKVLIIDDDPISAHIMAERLSRLSDYKTLLLADPHFAVRFIRKEAPEIVLLDYVMPGMTGVDCLRLIRAEFTKDQLPVIMLTSDNSEDTINDCFQNGATDFITKGTPFSVISSRIAAHLSVVNLMRTKIRLNALDAIHAMIVAYNHEINNPLAVAISALSHIKKHIEPLHYDRINNALWKISEVVRALRELESKSQEEFEKYVDNVRTNKTTPSSEE